MRPILIALALLTTAGADTRRVLVDGAGCRTRQLAMQRIWEKLPDVEQVTILPRDQAPRDNQRYFIIVSRAQGPSQAQLIEALGRRAKHYKVLEVTPVPDG